MSTAEILYIIVALLSGVFGAVVGGYFQRRNMKLEVRYTWDYEQRAKVIEQLYKLVIEAQRSVPHLGASYVMGRVTIVPETLFTQMRTFLTSIEELSRYYTASALWFDQKTDEAVQHFLDESISTVSSSIEATHPEIKLWHEFIDQPPVLQPEASAAYLRERVGRIPYSPQKQLTGDFDELRHKEEVIHECFHKVRQALEEEFRRNLQS